MLRRQFLQSIAALAVAPVLPAVLPEPVLPTYIKSTERFKLYCSPETLEDIKNWGVDQIDEQTRREIYCAS